MLAEATSVLESHWSSVTYKELTQLIGVARDVVANSSGKSPSVDFEVLLKEIELPVRYLFICLFVYFIFFFFFFFFFFLN